jgi:hypothetical protein
VVLHSISTPNWYCTVSDSISKYYLILSVILIILYQDPEVVLHSITDSIRIPKWSPVCGVTPRVALLVFDRSAEELGVYPIYLHDAPSSDSNFDDARIGPLVRVLRYGVCFAMKSIKLESGLQLNYPTIPHALSHIWNSYLQTKFTTRVYLLQTPQEGPIPPEDSGSPISPRTSCARVWMYVCVRVQRGGEGGGQEGLAPGKAAGGKLRA